MKVFEFIPLVSIGNVFFGEDRGKVRSNLGSYSEFRKAWFSENTTDDFGFCHVYYDMDNKCEAVEFFDSGTPIFFNGEDLFSLDYDSLKARVKEADCSVEIDESGLTSRKIQLGIYAPSNSVESILVAKEGYY